MITAPLWGPVGLGDRSRLWTSGGRARSWWVRCLVLVALTVGAPAGAWAQEPPDTVRVVPDSILADSLASDSLMSDSLLAAALLGDTLEVDSLAVDTLPLFDLGAPAHPDAGVWEWNQEQLLWAPGFTLADLLRDVPGLWLLRTGDYGAPATTAGFGTGRLRVRVDGVEWTAYEGGVIDLAQVPLAGLRSVRVRRGVGGTTIDLYSLRPDDARAYSVIEAGTGDLQTNLFRGTFLLPGALGGTLTGVLERVDTQGDRGEEPGALTGLWLRYTYTHGRRGGFELDYRSRTATQELFVPNEFSRSDLTFRGRYRLAEGVVASAHYTSTSSEGLGGLAADTITGEALAVEGEGVTQLGADLSIRRGPAWGRAAFRSFSGVGVPSSAFDVDVGVAEERWGGAAVELARQAWEGASTTRTGLRAWTTDRYGVYGFFEVDRGETGIPFVPLVGGGLVQLDSTGVAVPVAPSLRIQDPTATRFGLGGRFKRAEVEAARLSVEADSVQPLGLPTDRGPYAAPGGKRSGVELRARIPLLLLDGLDFLGSAVRWDAPEDGGVDPWPYLPTFSYDARLHYRNTFLPTENFELLTVLGIRERDPMTVFTAIDTLAAPVADPDPPVEGESSLVPSITSVPFFQSWYARLEIRIVSLRVFVEWENLTLRDANQDFVDRVLPRTRAMYGVRWTLRN